jgi:Ca-activated chloride channel family protein
VLLGLSSLALEFRQRPKPRQVVPREQRRAATARAAGASSLAASLTLFVSTLAALGIASEARAHFDTEAEFEVRQEFESNPVDRLRKITEHLAQFDYDAFDLQLMVEASIQYGIDAQRTGTAVSEGVIRDAIEASHRGEKLDTSIADWSYYRAQLAAMLESREGTAQEEESQARKQLMDEEDNPPTVTGESSQSFANDSFGQGASTKTDAALGDLTPGEEIIPQRGKKPPPPKNVRTATATRAKSGGGDSEDPILKLTRKRFEETVKKDSPGRVHQLLAESTELQHPENQVDW